MVLQGYNSNLTMLGSNSSAPTQSMENSADESFSSEISDSTSTDEDIPF